MDGLNRLQDASSEHLYAGHVGQSRAAVWSLCRNVARHRSLVRAVLASGVWHARLGLCLLVAGVALLVR